MPKSKFSHFTLDNRKLLSRLLDENASFRKIAKIIGCATSSITNEIKSTGYSKIIPGELPKECVIQAD